MGGARALYSASIIMAGQSDKEILSLDDLETALASDTKIKLAGIDIDGMTHLAPNNKHLLTRDRNSSR